MHYMYSFYNSFFLSLVFLILFFDGFNNSIPYQYLFLPFLIFFFRTRFNLRAILPILFIIFYILLSSYFSPTFEFNSFQSSWLIQFVVYVFSSFIIFHFFKVNISTVPSFVFLLQATFFSLVFLQLASGFYVFNFDLLESFINFDFVTANSFSAVSFKSFGIYKWFPIWAFILFLLIYPPKSNFFLIFSIVSLFLLAARSPIFSLLVTYSLFIISRFRSFQMRFVFVSTLLFLFFYLLFTYYYSIDAFIQSSGRQFLSLFLSTDFDLLFGYGLGSYSYVANHDLISIPLNPLISSMPPGFHNGILYHAPESDISRIFVELGYFGLLCYFSYFIFILVRSVILNPALFNPPLIFLLSSMVFDDISNYKSFWIFLSFAFLYPYLTHKKHAFHQR